MFLSFHNAAVTYHPACQFFFSFSLCLLTVNSVSSSYFAKTFLDYCATGGIVVVIEELSLLYMFGGHDSRSSSEIRGYSSYGPFKVT